MNDITDTTGGADLSAELEKLAAEAEAEDHAPEFEAVGDQEQAEIDAEQAARRCAAGVIHGLAFGVKQVWQVEYPPETKAEGVEKLTPCFEGGDGMPQWLVDALGKYGKFLEAGVWFAGVGFGTYQAVQQRKAEEAKANPAGTLQVQQPGAAAEFGGEGFASAGD